MTETETAKFIENLKTFNKTPEEIGHEKNKQIAKDAGKVFGYLLVLLAESTIVWAILTFIFTVSVTWVQVLGGLVLFNIARSLILKSYVK